MKNKLNDISKRVVMGALVAILALATIIVPNAWADNSFGFAVAPMKQLLVLNPGESYSSSFYISNPPDESSDIEYEISVNNLYVDESYNVVFEEYGSTGEIKNWIEINSPTTGTLSPNDKAEISYTINVPEDAAGGGQYAAISVKANNAGNEENMDDSESGMMIKEEKIIAYSIYAEITGDIIRQGEIVEANVPSFLLSGDITGSSSIKNIGNVHGEATYKMQVFPLFSDEEIYTNEESPSTATILPDRTRYEEIAWEGTPDVGIFNVVYTVEFEGVTEQVSKMVIKCPVWLLFIIFFVIAAIIIWIVMRVRGRKKSARKSD